MNSTPVPPVDLSTCDREPIHIPGMIQPHGCLLVLRRDAGGGVPVIEAASANAAAMLGVGDSARGVVGRGLDEVFEEADTRAITERVTPEVLQLHPVYIHAARSRGGVGGGGRRFNAVAHRLEEFIGLELEMVAEGGGDVSATDLYRLLQTAMVELRESSSVRVVCARLADHVRAITGFDRVMTYRFDEKWNGEVIAEAKRGDLEPFLGLHYPAADIPKQARELYTRNWLRFIPDVRYVPVQLTPSAMLPGTSRPLDMSFCILRSVSPIHIEYLRNMGVCASMSISLLKEGRLWGLVACHHYTPRLVGYDMRAACELIGQVVSLQLAERERTEIREDLRRGEETIRGVMAGVQAGPKLVSSLFDDGDRIMGLVGCGGAALVMGTEVHRVGQTPSVRDIRAIAERVDAAEGDVFVTESLSEHLPGTALNPVASGVLAVRLARGSRGCVMWFRPEQVRTVDWAGDPAKTVSKGPAPARLSPRGSFALWQETVRGRSLAWTSAELAVAAEFREALVLKIVEQSSSLISHNSILRRSSAEKDETIETERAARVQAERLNRLTDEFVATLSHELRTPLNAIQGWVHLLRTGSASADLAKGLEVIDRNAKAQNDMVNDLLDISRINAGKLRLDVQPVVMSQVVEAAIATVQLAADAKEIRLEADVDSTVMVDGDPQRLQQVSWNLLSNAIKFTPRGGLVKAELKRVGSHVELNVRDNGVGIDKEFLPHVFDRFRQADASTTRSFGGLGLGLSIVRHLTEMHGGTIAVESAGRGHGALFTVTLPLRGESTRAVEAEPVTAEALSLTGVRAMVVEDDPDARELVRRLLESYGCEVTAAGSVPEAMEVVRAKEFDVVISDIGMPGEDGYTFIGQLRALEAQRKQRRVPCVALTAYARADDRRRIMMAGFQVHVAKPVEPSELIAVVANLTGRIEG